MANILYIAQFFSTETEPGGQGQRHYKHAKALAESGHHVTVITSGTTTMSAPLPTPKDKNKAEKSAKKQSNNITIAAKPNPSSKRIPDGSLTVIHIPTAAMSKRSVLSRAYRYFEFSFKALLKGFELTLNPSNLFHYVLGSSPPILIGLIAYILSVVARAEFILEVRDLWSQTMESNGFINNRWIIDVNRALESFLYRASKKIITVSDAFIPVIEEQVDGSASKLVDIPNGADLEFYEYPLMWQGTYFSDETEKSLKTNTTAQKNFNVVYAGVFSDYTNVESILETALLLQKTHPHIKFHLAGGGYQEQKLKALKESMRLENVYFWGVLPKQRISKFISEGDVSLINYRDLDIYGKVLPNKLFDYLAAANPIIACAPKGSVTDVIEASNSGFCLTPEKPLELANKLVWLSDNPNEVSAMGQQGKNYVREHFNRDTLVRQFVSLFPSIIPFPQAGHAQEKKPSLNNLLDFRRKLP